MIEDNSKWDFFEDAWLYCLLTPEEKLEDESHQAHEAVDASKQNREVATNGFEGPTELQVDYLGGHDTQKHEDRDTSQMCGRTDEPENSA